MKSYKYISVEKYSSTTSTSTSTSHDFMSKSGVNDEVLIKLIVGVVKHATIDELRPVERLSRQQSIFVDIS
jgi:hypothetical protein